MNGKEARQVSEVPGFERRVAEVLQHKHRWRWRILWLWIILFTGLFLYLWHVNNDRVKQIKSNEVRINILERHEHCLPKHSLKYCKVHGIEP